MSAVTPDGVREFLLEYLSRRLNTNERNSCDDLSEDCDIFLTGMIDSLGLLELVGAIQEFTGTEIDFDALDPEQMTIVGPLCRFVSEQVSKQP
jgi:acyl carrier protein